MASRQEEPATKQEVAIQKLEARIATLEENNKEEYEFDEEEYEFDEEEYESEDFMNQVGVGIEKTLFGITSIVQVALMVFVVALGLGMIFG